MKTFAWMVDSSRETYVLALHGDVALLVNSGLPNEVWQYRSGSGRQKAIDRLVAETASIEKYASGKVRDPVEFDLSPEAIDEIRAHDAFSEWVQAPRLREELMMAVEPPSVFSSHAIWHATAPPPGPAVATMHFDPSKGVAKVWTGTEWSTLGTVNAKTLGIEMSPEGRGTIGA